MSLKGSIPFDLTRVQSSFLALHRVYPLSLYEKLILKTASNNAKSSTL